MCDTAQMVPIHFWQMGNGRVVRTLATIVGSEVCLWDSGVPGSPRASTSWSNSLIIGIYPAASARRHVIISTSHKINQPIPRLLVTWPFVVDVDYWLSSSLSVNSYCRGYGLKKKRWENVWRWQCVEFSYIHLNPYFSTGFLSLVWRWSTSIQF